MLDSTGLIAAGARNSKNPYFSGLLEEVETYNAMVSPVNKQPKADQLLRGCLVLHGHPQSPVVVAKMGHVGRRVEFAHSALLSVLTVFQSSPITQLQWNLN